MRACHLRVSYRGCDFSLLRQRDVLRSNKIRFVCPLEHFLKPLLSSNLMVAEMTIFVGILFNCEWD